MAMSPKTDDGDSSTTTTTTCTYSIAVRTSAIGNAATTAYVLVQLVDEFNNVTDRVKLKCSATHRKKYQRGHSDLFLLIDQPVLGRIKKIHITHRKRKEAEEDQKAWHLHSMMVFALERNELYRFPCHKWIGDNNERDNTMALQSEGEPYLVFNAEADEIFE